MRPRTTPGPAGRSRRGEPGEPGNTHDEPALRVLSLGAGAQSTALLILAARHPDRDRWGLDAAVFADTFGCRTDVRAEDVGEAA